MSGDFPHFLFQIPHSLQFWSKNVPICTCMLVKLSVLMLEVMTCVITLERIPLLSEIE